MDDEVEPPRRVRRFVLALVVVSCLSLTGASTAQAEAGKFEASAYPALFSGSQSPTLEFTAAGGAVNCTEATFTGELESASSTISIAPTFDGCTAFGFVGATVTANGCEYLFHLGTEGEEGDFPATTDIVCPEGKEITIDAGVCTVHIPAQSGLGQATVSGEADAYTVDLALTGIEGSLTKNNFLCFFTAGKFTNGAYSGVFDLSTLPALTAGAYPASLTGSQEGLDEFNAAGGAVRCNKVTSSGKLNLASRTWSLAPSYAECTAFGFLGATVTTNGCEYLFHLGEETEEGVHAGTTDIVCPAGKEITVDAGPCTAHIPPQGGLGTLTVENESGAVRIETELTGIEGTLTKNNFLCFFTAGKFTAGAYSGEAVLEGEAEGEPVEIDIGMAPHETPDPPTPGAFTTVSYPGALGGVDTGTLESTFAGASFGCNHATFSGTIVESSSTQTITPAYSECSGFFGAGSTMTMNSCDYVFEVGEGSGGVYPATTDIVCPAGKEITWDAGPCTVHVPGQSGLGPIVLENQSGGILVKTSITGIVGTATKNVGTCPLTAGSFSNGTFTGSLVLTGKNSEGNPQDLDVG